MTTSVTFPLWSRRCVATEEAAPDLQRRRDVARTREDVYGYRLRRVVPHAAARGTSSSRPPQIEDGAR